MRQYPGNEGWLLLPDDFFVDITLDGFDFFELDDGGEVFAVVFFASDFYGAPFVWLRFCGGGDLFGFCRHFWFYGFSAFHCLLGFFGGVLEGEGGVLEGRGLTSTSGMTNEFGFDEGARLARQ